MDGSLSCSKMLNSSISLSVSTATYLLGTYLKKTTHHLKTIKWLKTQTKSIRNNSKIVSSPMKPNIPLTKALFLAVTALHRDQTCDSLAVLSKSLVSLLLFHISNSTAVFSLGLFKNSSDWHTSRFIGQGKVKCFCFHGAAGHETKMILSQLGLDP